MSPGSLKMLRTNYSFTTHTHAYIYIYIYIYIYKDLALNNLQELIYHKIRPINQLEELLIDLINNGYLNGNVYFTKTIRYL